MSLRHCYLTSLILLLLVGCSGSTEDSRSEVERPTRWPGKTWDISTPEEEGMDSNLLEAVYEYTFAPNMNTQSVVIVRNGVIVSERYYGDLTPDTPATSWSMAKSYLSALIGIAIEEGLISSVDEKVSTFVPQWKDGPNKDITLRALLEMRSGLDPHPDPDGLYANAHQLEMSLDREKVREPHTQWQYVNEDSMVMSLVLQTATGKPVDEYAKEKIFDPIEMSVANWWKDEDGYVLTYCCLDSTTRDFARFGLLYLRNGKWKDEQLVPQDWVEESTEPLPGVGYYAMHWWTTKIHGHHVYFAYGYHQQKIYVIPDLNIVAVRNGTYWRGGEGYVRTGNAAQFTLPPATWADTNFLDRVVTAVVD